MASTALAIAKPTDLKSEEDDMETWELLASPFPAGNEISPRLDSLARRFDDDVDTTVDADYWKDLCRQAASRGFLLSDSGLTKHTSLTAPGDEIPALFKSDIGKKHTKAAAALMDVPEAYAARLTLNALHLLSNDDSSYQSLIGTHELVIKTLRLHFEQRLSRLSVITECLRLELDENIPNRESLLNLLDSIDSTYLNSEEPRGLFRRLLTISCRPEARFTREQLQPSQELRSSTPSAFQQSFVGNAGDNGWNHFVSQCNDAKRIQTGQERKEAMEALLVLLYSRISGGVKRSDYAIVLIALRSANSFFTTSSGGSRLSQLAGLICAECTALWRIFGPQEVTETWIASHPLFYGVMSSDRQDHVETEIESLKNLIYDCMAKLAERNEKQLGVHSARGGSRELQTEAPEALALLSLGLLLSLAGRSLSSTSGGTNQRTCWSTFQEYGREMTQLSNDKFEAFSYLYFVMDCLTAEESETNVPKVDSTPHDWQLSVRNASRLLVENDPAQQVGGPNLVYATIAREVLEASVSTFEEFLSLGHENASVNIGMLTNLASAVFRHSPSLCAEFWDTWNVYMSSEGPSTPLPLCRLLVATQRLAKSAIGNSSCRDGAFLSMVAPLFTLLGSLCFDSSSVESIVSALPTGLIRRSLLYCSSNSETSQKSSLVVLQAISAFAKVGKSRSCREELRVSLEESRSSQVDGPRVLSRILNESANIEIVRCVMGITANLLEHAPQVWSLQLGDIFMRFRGNNNGLAALLAHQNEATHSAALVLSGLVDQMIGIVFTESFDAARFLRFMAEAALAAGTALAASCSLVRRDVPTSYDLAYTILEIYSNILNSIRTVMEVHKEADVRSSAAEARDSLVSFLASSSGLAEAIAYYATAPVSLSLAIRVQRFLDDENVVRAVSSSPNGDENNNKKYGAWFAVTAKKTGSRDDDIATAARGFLLGIGRTSESLDLDLRGIHARGWTNEGDEAVPIRTASAAVRLLATWAGQVEDIVSKRRNVESRNGFDNDTKKLLVSLSPQRLIGCVARCPNPIRTNGTLSSAWASAGLSNFDLMLHLISNDNHDELPMATTLDLLNACISHAQCSISSDEAVDAQLLRSFHRSTKLLKLLVDSAWRASNLPGPERLIQEGKQTILYGLLGLRLLAAAIKANPSYVESVLDLDQSTVAGALVKPISTARHMLQSASGDYASRVLLDEASIIQLRLAGGCLNVIHSLWTTEYTSVNHPNQSCRSRLSGFLNFEHTVLKDLLAIVTEHAEAANEASPCESVALGGSCALATLMAIALDILSAEMGPASNTDANFMARRRLFEASLGEKQSKLTVMARSFACFRSFSMIENATSDIVRVLGTSRLGNAIVTSRSLLASIPSTSLSVLSTDFYVRQNSFDIQGVARWLATFVGQNGAGESLNEVVEAWALSHQVLSCETELLSSWKKFVEVLSFFLNDSSTTVDSSRAFVPSPGTVIDLLRETLGALNKNSDAVQLAQIDLAEETQLITKELSGMILFFSDLAAANEQGIADIWDMDSLLETLGLLIQASEKSYTIGIPVHPTEKSILAYASLQQQLLASAVTLVVAIESKVVGTKKIMRRRRDDLYDGLIGIVGKVLQVLASLTSTSLVQHSSNKDQHCLHRDSFLTCSSLMTLLVLRTKHSTSSDEFHAYVAKIFKTLREQSVLEYLLGYAVMESKTVAANMHAPTGSKVRDSKNEADTSIIKSVLSLLQAIADVGDAQMLSLLETSSFVQLVVNNPLFAVNIGSFDHRSANSRRGYVPSGDHGASQRKERSVGLSAMASYSGRDDPVHEVWLKSMMVLKASLRSSTIMQTPQTTRLQSQFFKVSTLFLGTYREKLLSCLEECSTASNGSKSSFFTLNLLREASSLLSLVSELCSRNIRDQFYVESRNLYDELVGWSMSVVVSISKFLGASGTSRELFLALSDFDAADARGGVDYPAMLKSRHPAFTGGVPNAKHEATRYSHFASGFCACVTRKDFEAASMIPSHLKHLSKEKAHDSVLERNCRRSVTSVFVLELERAAADVLSQAVSVIWSTHPASSSFVTLSEREASRIDTMRTVTSGMVIGFRPARKRRLGVGRERDEADSIMFGKVLSSDTVNRCWHVEVVGEQPRQVTVPVCQLAGMEDMSKRKCVASYRPAPDSATDLESMEGALTLGHLILALRWCHQTSIPEIELGASRDKYGFVQRLAEQVSALLGSELSLHEVVGSGKHMSKANQTRLDSQILELFGDAPTKGGHLGSLLSDASWRTIQPQIRREVERARSDIEEDERKRSEGRSPHASEGLWYRRAHNSPFRGML